MKVGELHDIVAILPNIDNTTEILPAELTSHAFAEFYETAIKHIYSVFNWVSTRHKQDKPDAFVVTHCIQKLTRLLGLYGSYLRNSDLTKNETLPFNQVCLSTAMKLNFDLNAQPINLYAPEIERLIMFTCLAPILIKPTDRTSYVALASRVNLRNFEHLKFIINRHISVYFLWSTFMIAVVTNPRLLTRIKHIDDLLALKYLIDTHLQTYRFPWQDFFERLQYSPYFRSIFPKEEDVGKLYIAFSPKLIQYLRGYLSQAATLDADSTDIQAAAASPAGLFPPPSSPKTKPTTPTPKPKNTPPVPPKPKR